VKKMARMTIASGKENLKILVKEINKIDKLNQWKLGKLHLIQDVGEDDIAVSRIDTLAGIKQSIAILEAEIKVIEGVSNKAKASLRIAFFNNENDDVQVFTSKAKALEFIQTDYIEDLMHGDEMNVIVMTLIIPCKPEIVQNAIKTGAINSSRDETYFRFDGETYYQVFDDDTVLPAGQYFKIKRVLGEVNATHADPDNPRRWFHSVDHDAIAKLGKKIKAMGKKNRGSKSKKK
jgi:hypothetical protein